MRGKDTEIIKGFLRFQTILIIAILLLLVFGSSSCCRQVGVSRSESDSTRVDIRYVEKEILKDTTIYIQIPIEKDMAITSDSSYLSTSVSESWAKVDTLGHLHHTLSNLPVKIANTIQYVDKIITRDSIIYVNREVDVERVQERVRHGWKWGFVGFGIGILMMFILWIRRR